MLQAGGVKFLQTACVLGVFGLAAAGCSPSVSELSVEQEEARVVEPVELPDLTFRWSAIDGVDVDMPEVEVVRAYAESEALHAATGDPGVTYPGFQEVMWYEIEDNPNMGWYLGTVDFRVLDVRDAVDRRGRDATQIAVCTWHDNAAVRWRDGEWRMGSGWGAFRTYRISAVVESTAEHPVAHGVTRMARPDRNVFDGWSVETSQFVRSLMSATDLGLSDLQEWCDTVRVTEADLQDPIIVSGPPEPLPFDPGWPVVSDGDR